MIKSTLVACFTVLLFATVSQAQADNRDYLIEKLQKVYLSLAPADSSKLPVTLRLADLLAERARVQSMEELNQGCTQCVAGKVDREKALNLYSEVIEKVPAASQSKVLLQMGHLYELVGKEDKALVSYERSYKDSRDGRVVAEAHLSLAEIHYKKSRWSQALSHYQQVTANKNSDSKGFALYRSAWAQFNMGEILQAKNTLLEVLSNPQNLSRSGSAQNQIDVSFQDEVAADYATFVGREYQAGDLDKVFNYAPQSTRIRHLETVAAELERTGKKSDAFKAWTFVYEKQSDPAARVRVQSHMAALSLEVGDRQEAVQHFEAVFRLVQQFANTQDSQVVEAQKVLRRSIVTWNQAEKKTPTLDLLGAYEGYLNTFGYEKEMGQWASQLAQSLGQWDRAWKLHTNSLAHVQGADLENQLLLGIELAEGAKNPKMLAQAQALYLEKAPLKKQFWAVKYQQTYGIYEQENGPAKALPAFKEIAVNPAVSQELRVKAGDLVLDILATQKNDQQLEIAAGDLIASFAGEKAPQTNWKEIKQKAILNQVAALSMANNSEAWTKLGTFKASEADDESKLIYFKNRLALAEKRGDITTALASAQEIQGLPYAKPEDKENAATNIAKFLDLKMDFNGAMKATQALPSKFLSDDKKALKLAMYAELTGQSSEPYLTQFIKATTNEEQRIAASFELLKKSKNFEQELNRNFAVLLKDSERLGMIIAEKFAETKSAKLLSLVEKDTKLRATAGGKLLIKDKFFDEFSTVASKLTAANVDTKNQKTIVATIKSRATMLDNIEKMTAKAIEFKDWSLQVVTLTVLGRESQRFYEELFSLPMPEGLTEIEQSEYMNLLSQQAAPYKTKADMALAKSSEFWSQDWKPALQMSLKNASLRAFVIKEVQALEKVATTENAESLKNQLADVQAEKTPANVQASFKSVEELRNKLRSSPMDIKLAQELLSAERLAGNKIMVQYLEGRIALLTNSEKNEVK